MPLGPFEAAIVDDDGLQDRQPVVGEQVGTRRQELVVVPPVDGLDHLDGDELVEPTPQVAPVVAQHRDTVGQAGLGHPLGDIGRAGPPRWSWSSPGIRSARLRGGRTRPSPTRSRPHGRRAAGQAWRRAGRSSPPGRRPAWPRGARTPRRSRSWSRRASARRSRWTGRSAPARCAGRRLVRVPPGAPARRARLLAVWPRPSNRARRGPRPTEQDLHQGGQVVGIPPAGDVRRRRGRPSRSAAALRRPAGREP